MGVLRGSRFVAPAHPGRLADAVRAAGGGREQGRGRLARLLEPAPALDAQALPVREAGADPGRAARRAGGSSKPCSMRATSTASRSQGARARRLPADEGRGSDRLRGRGRGRGRARSREGRRRAPAAAVPARHGRRLPPRRARRARGDGQPWGARSTGAARAARRVWRNGARRRGAMVVPREQGRGGPIPEAIDATEDASIGTTSAARLSPPLSSPPEFRGTSSGSPARPWSPRRAAHTVAGRSTRRAGRLGSRGSSRSGDGEIQVPGRVVAGAADTDPSPRDGAELRCRRRVVAAGGPVAPDDDQVGQLAVVRAASERSRHALHLRDPRCAVRIPERRRPASIASISESTSAGSTIPSRSRPRTFSRM